MTNTPLFPILVDHYIRDKISVLRLEEVESIIIGIPWYIIQSHGEQAIKNHGQPLRMLASRGGLSACEAIAVLEDRAFKPIPFAEAYKKLQSIIENRRTIPLDEEPEPGEHQEVLDAIEACNTGEEV